MIANVTAICYGYVDVPIKAVVKGNYALHQRVYEDGTINHVQTTITHIHTKRALAHFNSAGEAWAFLPVLATFEDEIATAAERINAGEPRVGISNKLLFAIWDAGGFRWDDDNRVMEGAHLNHADDQST